MYRKMIDTFYEIFFGRLKFRNHSSKREKPQNCTEILEFEGVARGNLGGKYLFAGLYVFH